MQTHHIANTKNFTGERLKRGNNTKASVKWVFV